MLWYSRGRQTTRVGHDISGQDEDDAQLSPPDVQVKPPDPSVENVHITPKPSFLKEINGVTHSRHPCSSFSSFDGVNSVNPSTFEEALYYIMRKHQSDLQELFHHFQIEPEVPEDRVNMSSITVPSAGAGEDSEARSIAASNSSEKHQKPDTSNTEVAETHSVCPSLVESEAPAPSIHENETIFRTLKRKATTMSFREFIPSWKTTRRTRWEMLQFRVWNFLEQPDGGISNHIFHTVVNVLIAVSVASPVMATTQISDDAKTTLSYADYCFTALFTIEFLTKLLFYPNRLAFLLTTYTLIDFAVVVAGLIGIFLANVQSIWLDLISIQMPILRLLKITRHSSGWRLLMLAMKNSVVPLLVPLYLMLLMIVFTGSLHFWIDNVLACTSADCTDLEQPAFVSIPHAMWFVLVSLSTVGYGDITPHTDVGKILACFQIVMGLCYMAMPLAIIGNSFSEVWNDRHRILLSDKLARGAIRRDIKDVKQLFYTFDDDKSGTISLNEFLPFVESLEMGLSKRVIHDLFRSIDLDGSGIISFAEFADFVFPDADREEIEE